MTRRKTVGTSWGIKGESLTVRLAPKARYMIELLARKQRRTISGVVDWLIWKAVNDPGDGLFKEYDEGKLLPLVDRLWSVSEFERIRLLQKYYHELMTFEEEMTMRIINLENRFWWSVDDPDVNERSPNLPLIDKNWEAIKARAGGDDTIEFDFSEKKDLKKKGKGGKDGTKVSKTK